MSQQSHFLVKMSEYQFLMATKTGGNPSTTVSRDYDGGATVPDVSVGRKTYDDMTLGKRFDLKDNAPARALLKQIGQHKWVSVQPTGPDYKPTGPSTRYSCVLLGVKFPDVDANGTGPARLEFTLAVKDII